MSARQIALTALAMALLSRAGSGQGLDRETAAAIGVAPSALTACVLGGRGANACPADYGREPGHRVRLDWKAPPLGTVSRYEVYRYRVVSGNRLKDAAARTPLCGTTGTPSCGEPSTTSFVDREALPSDGSFVYFVVAEFADSTRSGPSNFATVTIAD